MSVKDVINGVVGSKDFKEKVNETSYLAHLFVKKEEMQWQIGFYNPEKDKMIVFLENGSFLLEDDVYKEEGSVTELSLDNVKVEFEQASSIVDESLQKYPQHQPTSQIFILQNLNQRILWNVTVITSTLHVLQLRIDANTGEVIVEKLENVMNFKV